MYARRGINEKQRLLGQNAYAATAAGVSACFDCGEFKIFTLAINLSVNFIISTILLAVL